MNGAFQGIVDHQINLRAPSADTAFQGEHHWPTRTRDPSPEAVARVGRRTRQEELLRASGKLNGGGQNQTRVNRPPTTRRPRGRLGRSSEEGGRRPLHLESWARHLVARIRVGVPPNSAGNVSGVILKHTLMRLTFMDFILFLHSTNMKRQ